MYKCEVDILACIFDALWTVHAKRSVGGYSSWLFEGVDSWELGRL
jgi:hypothetical protein